MPKEQTYSQYQDEALKINQAKHAGEYFALQLESKKNPSFPSLINAVLIFGCADSESWMQGMNVSRIESGFKLARTLTAVRKKQAETGCQQTNLTKADYSDFSPFLIYNGTLKENEAFRRYYQEHSWHIPEEKILVLDNFRKNGKSQEHRNTRDQVQSLFTSLEDPRSPIFQAKNIGLLSHSPQFMRIRHYAKKEEEGRYKPFDNTTTFWAYSPELRCEDFVHFMNDELEKLGNYLQIGEIPHEPSTNVLVA